MLFLFLGLNDSSSELQCSANNGSRLHFFWGASLVVLKGSWGHCSLIRPVMQSQHLRMYTAVVPMAIRAAVWCSRGLLPWGLVSNLGRCVFTARLFLVFVVCGLFWTVHSGYSWLLRGPYAGSGSNRFCSTKGKHLKPVLFLWTLLQFRTKIPGKLSTKYQIWKQVFVLESFVSWYDFYFILLYSRLIGLLLDTLLYMQCF